MYLQFIGKGQLNGREKKISDGRETYKNFSTIATIVLSTAQHDNFGWNMLYISPDPSLRPIAATVA